MIRIIGGKNRSRKLLTLDDNEITKPTKDMVREAIFNAIGMDIINATTLDLFGGSGALSFEALSRGAIKAYINDANYKAINIIKENAKALNENPIITNLDYKEFLDKTHQEKFDVVFLDPPYKMDIYNEVVIELISKELVSNKAIFVLESNRELEIDSALFSKIKKYKYGYTLVHILWR